MLLASVVLLDFVGVVVNDVELLLNKQFLLLNFRFSHVFVFFVHADLLLHVGHLALQGPHEELHGGLAGKELLDVAWDAQSHIEHAKLWQEHVAVFLLDYSKFFDRFG